MNAQAKPQAPSKPGTTIAEFSATEAALADLKQRYANVVMDPATREGMAFLIKGRAELRTYRVNVEKTRVELKAPLLERERLLDAEAKRLTAELAALEEPIDAQIKAEENRKEEERKAKEAAEAARLQRLQDRIASFSTMPTEMVGCNPDAIAEKLTEVKAIEIGDEFGELRVSAHAAKQKAIAALEQLHAGAIAQEEQARRAAEQRAREEEELAQLRREAEVRAREDEERRIADQARIVEEAKKRAADEEARAKEDRERKARIAEEERQARAKIEAEEKASRDRIAAAQRVADEKAAREREERAAEEAKLKAERDKVEEEKRQVALREAELMDGKAILLRFKQRFGGVNEFVGVVKAIDAYLGKGAA